MILHLYRSGDINPETIPLKDKPVIIGCAREADIVLPPGDVSPRHARLVPTNGEWVIEELDAKITILVNKVPLLGRKKIRPGTEIQMGSHRLVCAVTGEAPAPPKTERRAAQPAIPAAAPPKSEKKELVRAKLSPEELKRRKELDAYKDGIHREMVTNLRLINLLEVDEGTRQKSMEIVRKLVAKNPPPRGVPQEQIVKEVFDEAFGLGPLESLLNDKTVTEVMVNRRDQIYVERSGKLTLTDCSFTSDEKLRLVIDRIVTPLGRRIDEGSPRVDARLKDGSRVNAIIPPLSIHGPCVTIRKFSDKPFTVDDLVGFGSFTREMGAFFKLAVRYRQNIVISGGTGSGKTTLLNLVSSFIPSDERIVTIEDAAELKLPQEHVVSLESRPPSIEGKGGIGIRELVINSLRMRPDRIVVGECRGKEALDMLQAMNTGHDGSLTTGHANTTRDILARLETMVLMAGMDLPVRAIREQISSAVDVIIQQTRMGDGSRKVIDVVEVTGMEGDKITLQQIFYFKQEGYHENGKVKGRFVATGMIPHFIQEIRDRGVDVDLSIFRKTEGSSE